MPGPLGRERRLASHSGTQLDTRGELTRRVAAIAARQHGVISLAQLIECGLSASGVRNWVAAGRLFRVHRGVYAVGRADLTAEGRRMAAVLACGPGAVLSHAAAAAHYGIRRSAASQIDVTVTRSSSLTRPGIRVHRHPELARDGRHGRGRHPGHERLEDAACPCDVSPRAAARARLRPGGDPPDLRHARDGEPAPPLTRPARRASPSQRAGPRGPRRERARERPRDPLPRALRPGRPAEARDQPLHPARRRVPPGRLPLAEAARRDRDGRQPLPLNRLAAEPRRASRHPSHTNTAIDHARIAEDDIRHRPDDAVATATELLRYGR